MFDLDVMVEPTVEADLLDASRSRVAILPPPRFSRPFLEVVLSISPWLGGLKAETRDGVFLIGLVEIVLLPIFRAG